MASGIAAATPETTPSPASRSDTAHAPASGPAPAPTPRQPANNPRADSASATTAATHYRIQIAAVGNKATAESVAGKLKYKGFDTNTVEDAGLFRVNQFTNTRSSKW